MSTKTQVATLAARGMSAAQISREIGVTEGYISQLQQDDEYLRLLDSIRKQAAGLASHSTHAKIDGHYDSLELKLVSTLDQNSDMVLAQMLDKPATLLTYMRTLNGAKRRSVGEAVAPRAAEQEYVPVILPAFLTAAVIPQVKHNDRNEVIEIGDRPLVSLSAAGLRNQLAQHKETKAGALAAIEVAAATAVVERPAEEQLDLFATPPVTQDSELLESPVAQPPVSKLGKYAQPSKLAMLQAGLANLREAPSKPTTQLDLSRL